MDDELKQSMTSMKEELEYHESEEARLSFQIEALQMILIEKKGRLTTTNARINFCKQLILDSLKINDGTLQETT